MLRDEDLPSLRSIGMGEEESNTRFIGSLEYAARVYQNRHIFLLNFGSYYGAFDFLLRRLQSIWIRIARERDTHGRSHVGLLLPATILANHLLLGFDHLANYQSFLAWPAFRPGLEALLFIGKWVDDPNVVEIWKDRHNHRNEYRALFSGRGLISRSLPRSAEFRNVLSRLNDEYLHPNAEFGYRQTRIHQASLQTLVLESPLFDRDPTIHEAHLLAYLHLSELICASSAALITSLLGRTEESETSAPSASSDRAKALAGAHTVAKKVLEELGLWSF
jgi:hypothetical protein